MIESDRHAFNQRKEVFFESATDPERYGGGEPLGEPLAPPLEGREPRGLSQELVDDAVDVALAADGCGKL